MNIRQKPLNFAGRISDKDKRMDNYGTLLVVDDNPAILTAVKICMATVFGRVLTLQTPEKLLATLAEERVDAVLLDMNFSLGANTGQDGLFWLRAVRKHQPDVPVVLMTAYADIQLAVRGLKDGASDFVTKPWENDDLARTLKDAVDVSREVSSLEEVETEHVRKVVNRCHGNVSQAAALLGITRQTLYAKLKKA